MPQGAGIEGGNLTGTAYKGGGSKQPPVAEHENDSVLNGGGKGGVVLVMQGLASPIPAPPANLKVLKP